MLSTTGSTTNWIDLDGDAWGVDGEDQTSSISRTGSVGIGLNSAPIEALHVEGNGLITGSVGIGTTTPDELLDVNGQAEIGSEGEEVHIGNVGFEG